jgi:hypothetical protein
MRGNVSMSNAIGVLNIILLIIVLNALSGLSEKQKEISEQQKEIASYQLPSIGHRIDEVASKVGL